MKRTLITGGAGFIGCNLANRLIGAGQAVKHPPSIGKAQAMLANVDLVLFFVPFELHKCTAKLPSCASKQAIIQIEAIVLSIHCRNQLPFRRAQPIHHLLTAQHSHRSKQRRGHVPARHGHAHDAKQLAGL